MQKTLEILAGLLVLAAVALNATSVISRYVFNHSYVWSDEILVYANIWVVVIGAIAATLSGEHLSIDVLRPYFARKVQTLQSAIIEAITAAVAVTAAVASYRAMSVIMRSNQKSVAAGMPMWVAHGAILLGFTAFALIAAWRLLNWRRGQ